MSTLISFDYAIKYLLKNKGDYDIVEGFISAILKSEGYGAIKIKALLESESNKDKSETKRSIADLIVEDEQGICYIVEIERAWTEVFMHKACFNTSRLIVDSINTGGDYQNIKKVFHISLLYFKWSNNDKPFHHGKTVFKEVDTQHPVDLHLVNPEGKQFDLSHLFPEYFLISIPLFDDVIRSEMDEWLYVMKNSDVKADFKSPYMKKIAERLNYLKMDADARFTYEKFMRETYKERDAAEGAIIQAKFEGKIQGRIEGKIEGKIERNIEIATKMLAKQRPLDEVSEFTGLSIQELKTLEKNQ
jgi:predicted transposase/invertase (TIGR01784 family)